MDGLKKFSERGYVVKEMGNVYFTLDMDATYRGEKICRHF
jgi:hypothetical protein